MNPLCSHSSPQWIGEISVSGIWPWFIGGIRQDFINENILKRKRSRPFNSTFVSHQTCLYGEKSFVKLSYELFTGLLSNLWVRFYSFVSWVYQKDEFVRFLHKDWDFQKRNVICNGELTSRQKMGLFSLSFSNLDESSIFETNWVAR